MLAAAEHTARLQAAYPLHPAGMTDIGTAQTATTRRSRMRRISTGKRIELTPRDLEIFKLLARYRYLPSTYIHAFVGGNKTKLIERLGNLYHEGGYLDRPKQQWETINARYMPVAYELGEASRHVLAEHGFDRPRRDHGGRQYRHEIMVCETVASIELRARVLPGVRFIPWDEILASPKMPATTRISERPNAVAIRASYHDPRTKSSSEFDGTLVPDAIFGLEYDRAGQKSFRFFALEADRNSEPAMRREVYQSSYARKVAQYAKVVGQAVYRSRWGLPNLLVLTVATNERHMHSLLDMVSQCVAGEAADHFLFRALPDATRSHDSSTIPDLLGTPWQRPGLGPLSLR